MSDAGSRKMELKQKLRARMQKIRDSNDVQKMSVRGLLMRRNMNPSERKVAIARAEAASLHGLNLHNLNNTELTRVVSWLVSSSK